MAAKWYRYFCWGCGNLSTHPAKLAFYYFENAFLRLHKYKKTVLDQIHPWRKWAYDYSSLWHVSVNLVLRYWDLSLICMLFPYSCLPSPGILFPHSVQLQIPITFSGVRLEQNGCHFLNALIYRCLQFIIRKAKNKTKKEYLHSADVMGLEGWDAVWERWGNVRA